MFSDVKFLLLSLLVFVLQCPQQVQPFGSGAPSSACRTMVPGHGQQIQSSDPPFQVTSNTTETFGQGTVVVTILGNPEQFKGFLIQARTDDRSPIGVFYEDPNDQSTKLSNCEGRISNTATHSNSVKKSRVTLTWEAPKDFEGDVTFTASLLKDFQTYWTNVESPKVKVAKRSAQDEVVALSTTKKPATKKPDTRVAAAPSTGGSIASKLNSLYDGCGFSKTCYGPTNKCIKQKNCAFMATYTNAGNGQFEIELVGKKDRERKYVALGLSSDDKMGDDSVMTCSNEQGIVDVYNTWNKGKNNQNVVKPKAFITVQETGEYDGMTYCRFLRPSKSRFSNVEFNLDSEKYHILIATGTMDSNGKLQYHNDQRSVSRSPVSLGVTSNLEARNTRLFPSIHGALMISAWIGAASCGMIIARYFKKTWLGSKCCNIDQWFHCHRFFMILTWSVTMTAFGIIVYELGEFRPTTHAIVGVCSIVLCFIQPFMAAIRPGGTAKNRGIFNFAHWFVGNSAQILGITAIFFGLELFMSGDRNWVKEFSWYIVIAYIVFYCLVHLILTIAQCISDRSPNEVGDVFPLKEFAGSRTPLQVEEKNLDAPGGGCRKFMLAIFLLFNWLFTTLLIILVIVPRQDIEEQWEAWNLPAFWEFDK